MADPIENGWFEKKMRGQDEPIVNPEPFEAEEVMAQIVEKFAQSAHYWATTPLEKANDTVRYRCDGVAFSILSLLDGCNINMPGFLLTPSVSEDDEEWRKARGIRYYNTDEFVNSQYSMHDYYHSAARDLDEKLKVSAKDRAEQTYVDVYDPASVTADSKIENMTPRRMGEALVAAAHHIAEHWGTDERDVTVRERCHATAHGVLGILEGKFENIPQFTVAPVAVSGLNHNTPVVRETAGDNKSPLRAWPFEERVMLNGLTEQYADRYEKFKPRFAASAKDLFN